jgi:hypothetical protein
LAPSRAFVLGNGPSIEDLDFSLLKGQFCFGMNRIHLVYGDTDWRPDVYVCSDYHYNPRVYTDVAKHVLYGYDLWSRESILLQAARHAGVDSWCVWKHARGIINCGHDLVDNHPATAWHLPHVCMYGGSMHAAIQIAITHYGMDELVLLGCDLDYIPFPPGTPDPNHFHREYQNGFNKDRVCETNDVQRAMWEIVNSETKERGVRVLNATPGGALDIFPRVSLDTMRRKHG